MGMDLKDELEKALIELENLADVLERRMTMKIAFVDKYIPSTRNYVNDVRDRLEKEFPPQDLVEVTQSLEELEAMKSRLLNAEEKKEEAPTPAS